ncbi:hypothetical protein GF324_02315 [bacterium]|nr:hypothetical protein [bacterium]
MKLLHRILLTIFYTFTVLVVIGLAVYGQPYYTLPVAERSHHPMYELWKPGGLIGHGLGVVGSVLLLMLLGYVLRKRLHFMSNWGNIRMWLNYHIWMGITGPLIILYHTSFKFGGIVAVSFWSMAAVALSGVLGRYLYLQIPRTRTGAEVGRQELEEQERNYWIELQGISGMDDTAVEKIKSHIGSESGSESKRTWSALPALVFGDLARPFRRMNLKRTLKRETSLDTTQIKRVMELADEQEKLARRIGFLDAAQAMLHHWHIIHRPFAAVMFLIMFVHIGVVVLFGYTWVF